MPAAAILIARKDLYLRFSNRASLLFLLALPLGLSLIITLVFGDLDGDGPAALKGIPLGVVNLDEGTAQQGRPINYGAGLLQLLTAAAPEAVAGAGAAACPYASAGGAVEPDLAMNELFSVQEVRDVAAGRDLVNSGELAALVIVPADFSTRLSPQIGPGVTILYPQAPASVEVYSDGSRALEGQVVSAVVAGYSERLLAGNIALGAAINGLIVQEPLAALRLAAASDDEAISAALACGFADLASGAVADVHQAGPVDDHALRQSTRVLAFVGMAQATFFALFAAQFGVLGVVEERRAGTLQRILTTSTTRSAFLAGKLLGTWVTALFQLLLLLIALSLFASLIEGRLFFLWSASLPALFAILLPLSLAVAGLGVVLVAFVQRVEQIGAIGALVNILLAMLGGAYGFTVPEPWSWLSLIYWGVEGMARLGAGDTAVGLNALVLTLQGLVLFGIGLWLFRRRVEV
ncbi:MAG: ABC transporter permease [Anaerolineaceae bacterium]|nr:ABC transporter permease [Anaerolineaceae bacterium]